MGPPPMVTRTNSTKRLLGVTASTLALATGATALPTGPAHAADPITAADQSYFAYYYLSEARNMGLRGKGVTIALIDGEVDTTAPELAKTNIIDKTPCTVTSSTQSKTHGTAMASIIASDAYGVAPDTTILSYRTSFPNQGDTSGKDCEDDDVVGVTKDDYASLMNHAMNDGATIINMSVSSDDHQYFLKWAVARAISQGVIVIAAAGNTARYSDQFALSWWAPRWPLRWSRASWLWPTRSGPRRPRTSCSSSSSTPGRTLIMSGTIARATAPLTPAPWSIRIPASTRMRTP